MPVLHQVMVEVLHVMERSMGNGFEARNLGTIEAGSSSSSSALAASATTSSVAAASPTNTQGSGGGSSGPTSSPLLFFVALGFGVVFTNLWIIVGVKYCFRYNARNRALRAGEDGEITLENMPTRPHRRRREKKLMSMDEVNERFPLVKYKAWVASRAREGLSTSGGVTAPPSRAGSVRDVDMTEVPSSPVDAKHSLDRTADKDRKSMDANATEKVHDSGLETLKEIQTTTSTVDQQHADGSDDEDDHIHTAVPPELLTNPGDSCAICIDTLEDDDDIRGLTCGHAFHAGCLDPWLTSRRACCPLCKADYYTPKPRPERTAEQEAAEAAQRRSGRTNMPQPPHSAWTGIRGSPRLMLPARFMSPATAPSENTGRERNPRSTRSRRQPDSIPQTAASATDAPASGASESAPASRWRVRNPFSGVALPRLPGRREGTATDATEPSPAQLEAGAR
ncbi:hypothetical protein BP6252_07144 [Coleophoma cylindrospora]|uniref:RING-type domain-containing protein n=1 Tax=Coleophoma cylindrospora TaxID=1849047 RepID=A0A3D8RGR6_9HELO|nr:hypothetical protein BP6252_07144 [Coleophoma cylindrospora]